MSAASSLPAAPVAAGARGIASRAEDGSDADLINSSECHGGSNSVNIATLLRSPVACISKPFCANARPNKICKEDDHSLFGSDNEYNYFSYSTASAHSKSHYYGDGLRHSGSEARDTAPSVGNNGGFQSFSSTACR